MKAIICDRPGGPEVLTLGEAPAPVPGPGEVLVRVRAAGVNRADLLQRMGKYPPPQDASPILGLELSGEVVTPGARWRPGDRVMALVSGGAYAEVAAVPEAAAMPVPATLSWTDAAALPEAFLTAWLNLVTLGDVSAGETVLVHAGASGVGSAAIQIARELGGTVLAIAGSPEKADLCRRLGATLVLDRHEGGIAERVLAATGGRGVDLVLDMAGAPAWNDNVHVLRPGGRLVLIGFLGGSRGDIDLGPVLRKSLRVTGTTLRGKPIEAKERLVRAFMDFAWNRFGDGRLRPVVDRVLPLSEASSAHAFMAENRNAGKIVLQVE